MAIINRQTTIGVIIPSYNDEKYLEECVMSVMNQPCKDYIVVIIDDGSTDNTLNIANGLKEKYDCISVIHQENAGVSSARNRGIEFCLEKNVKYIAFLDSDDVWCTNFYTDGLRDEFLQNDRDAYQFNHYSGNEALTRGNVVLTVFKDIHIAPPDHFCSIVYRADILRNSAIRFPVGIRFGEDHTFKHLFFSLCKSYEHFDFPIFIYRNNRWSVLHQKHDWAEYFDNVFGSWSFVNKTADGLNEKRLADYALCLVKTHLAEYVVVACKFGDSLRKIQGYLSQSKFTSLYDNDNVWVDDKSLKNWLSFSKHPRRFWFKKRAGGGVAFCAARKLKHLILVQRLRYHVDLADKGIYTPENTSCC